MRNLTITNVFITLGLLFLLAGAGAANTPQGDTDYAFIGAIMFLIRSVSN